MTNPTDEFVAHFADPAKRNGPMWRLCLRGHLPLNVDPNDPRVRELLPAASEPIRMRVYLGDEVQLIGSASTFDTLEEAAKSVDALNGDLLPEYRACVVVPASRAAEVSSQLLYVEGRSVAVEIETAPRQTQRCRDCDGQGWVTITTGDGSFGTLEQETCDPCHGRGYVVAAEGRTQETETQ